MDIMGFQDRVFRDNHNDVLDIMKELSNCLTAINNVAEKRMAVSNIQNEKENVDFSCVKAVFFSDSIFIVSSDDSIISFARLCATANFIIAKAMLKKIPMKGAIAYGEMTSDFNRSIHFGKPLIDAYNLQQELYLYAVVLHHTAEKELINRKILNIFEKQRLSKYNVPLKNGIAYHYVLKWDNNLIKQPFDEIASTFYETVSGQVRCYVDHTLEFAKYLIERNEETK
jgi:ABC-type multidrug transport system fused ATPase/permease subunit